MKYVGSDGWSLAKWTTAAPGEGAVSSHQQALVTIGKHGSSVVRF